MSPGLLDNCRQFYAQCLSKGRIPVDTKNGKWAYSSKPEAFNDYLAKFNAEERKYITKGMPSPKSLNSVRAEKILSELTSEKRESLRQALLENDPWIASQANMT